MLQSIHRMAGISTVAREHADMLTGGAEVTIITPRYPGRAQPQSESPGDCTFALCLRGGNAALVPQAFFLFRNFDIIHFHCPFIGCGLAAVFAILCVEKRSSW